MLFQVLDYKDKCSGYFADNKLHKGAPIPIKGETWTHTKHLEKGEYELGSIYASGATITDVCPSDLTEEWRAIKKTLRAYLKALNLAQVSLESNCFYDVVPEFFLYRFLRAKAKITQHVLGTYARPKNYDAMYCLIEMLTDVRCRHLNIDVGPIRHLLSSVRGRNFHRTLHDVKPICDYNPWGTITGRLATNPHTFPILTMNKEFRGCVKPTNDWILELDFNAAELRVLLALAGVEQPRKDIHDWNAKHIFKGNLNREEAKTKTFAWLYSCRDNKELGRLYNKELVQRKYWDGYKIETDYGRIIENVDEHHALNYIVQSTTIDMVHEQAYKIYELLKERKSYISFFIHDAVYIDLAEEDRYEILNLLDIFKQTRYGMFRVNVSAGRNLGELQKLKL